MIVPSTTSRDKADVAKSDDDNASGNGMRDNKYRYNKTGTTHRIVRVYMERLRDESGAVSTTFRTRGRVDKPELDDPTVNTILRETGIITRMLVNNKNREMLQLSILALLLIYQLSALIQTWVTNLA